MMIIMNLTIFVMIYSSNLLRNKGKKDVHRNVFGLWIYGCCGQ